MANHCNLYFYATDIMFQFHENESFFMLQTTIYYNIALIIKLKAIWKIMAQSPYCQMLYNKFKCAFNDKKNQ